MKDKNKTKKHRINKLSELRKKISEQGGMKKEFEAFKKTTSHVDRELESISMELAISLYEVFEALKKISSGDPEVRISEEYYISCMNLAYDNASKKGLSRR